MSSISYRVSSYTQMMIFKYGTNLPLTFVVTIYIYMYSILKTFCM